VMPKTMSREDQDLNPRTAKFPKKLPDSIRR